MVVRLSKAEAIPPGRDIRRYAKDMITQIEAEKNRSTWVKKYRLIKFNQKLALIVNFKAN